MTFLLMSGNSKCRSEVTSTALPTVVYLSRSHNAEARCTCARTLGVLAWHDDSRGALSGVGVARALVGIIEDFSEVNNNRRESEAHLLFVTCICTCFFATQPCDVIFLLSVN